MKGDLNKSIEDTAVFLLGVNGLTEKTPIESMKAIDLISRGMDKSYSSSKRVFYRATEKDLLVKIQDNPALYTYTEAGWLRYRAMKDLETQLEGAENTLEDLIKRYYWDPFLTCVNEHKPLLEVKFSDMEKVLGLEFMDNLIHKPDLIEKLNKILQEMDLPVEDPFRPKISIVNMGRAYTLKVEEARQSKYVGQLVEVEGRVMVQTDVRPSYKVAAFKCVYCESLTFVHQAFGRWVEPHECENDICGRKGHFKLSHEDSDKEDLQTLYLESAQGQVQIQVMAAESLCAPPWERDAKFIKVVGIVEVFEVHKNSSVAFDFIIRANSIKLADDSSLEPPTEEEIKMFEEWAKDPESLRDRIVRSVAPHVIGRAAEKDTLSLSLFSDWTWNLPSDKVLKRSSLHVLLIGDPGVAKSQMIRDIMKLAPSAIMGQGENATGKGLSNACVLVNGVWVIKAGLFAKADKGLVGLDELDKLSIDDLTTLNSILEYQRQIADKAGIHMIFDTRCAAICGANPKDGHLNTYDPIIDQLGLSSFLFQRFDMVFVLQDVPSVDLDSRIFQSNYKTHNNGTIGDKIIERPISVELFKKYVLYARTKPLQTVSQEAAELLESMYVRLRNSGKRDYPAVSARTADALLKLTTCIARRELAPVATKAHAEYAIKLFQTSILSLGYGQELDFYAIEQGGTRSQLDRIAAIRRAFDSTLKDAEVVYVADVVKWTGYDQETIEHTLRLLEEKGDIMRFKDGWRKRF